MSLTTARVKAPAFAAACAVASMFVAAEEGVVEGDPLAEAHAAANVGVHKRRT